MLIRSLQVCLAGGCVVLWLLVLLNATAQPAYAYVDPGSGLLLIQVVSSTFVGITFLLRKRVREFFRRFGKHSD
jgi:hypothetical protein